MNTDKIDAQIEIVSSIIRKNDTAEKPMLTEHDRFRPGADLPGVQMMKPVICPLCNSPEVDPETRKLNIRAYKVDNWSQCLRNDRHGTVRLDGEETDVTSFWFNEDQTEFEINHERYVQQ